ncbi:MAG: chromate transporter [Acidobacteriales bacterium]|nr:chromate transporter [Terriglobales bacterium]
MPKRVGLAKVSALYLRICNLTFGGGDPTMAALQRELLERRGWITREQYGLIYSLARITPGTNMLAFCAGAAWQVAGWWGAILAVLASTLPSAALVVWLTYEYGVMQHYPLAMGAIDGIIASAVGMMAAGAWQLIRPHVKRGMTLRTLVLVAASTALAMFAGRTPIEILALAALVGAFWRTPEVA